MKRNKNEKQIDNKNISLEARHVARRDLISRDGKVMFSLNNLPDNSTMFVRDLNGTLCSFKFKPLVKTTMYIQYFSVLKTCF